MRIRLRGGRQLLHKEVVDNHKGCHLETLAVEVKGVIVLVLTIGAGVEVEEDLGGHIRATTLRGGNEIMIPARRVQSHNHSGGLLSRLEDWELRVRSQSAENAGSQDIVSLNAKHLSASTARDLGIDSTNVLKKKEKGTTTTTHHGSHNGSCPRGQPEGGARRVGTSSATAPTQLYAAQIEETRDTSVVKDTIIF